MIYKPFFRKLVLIMKYLCCVLFALIFSTCIESAEEGEILIDSSNITLCWNADSMDGISTYVIYQRIHSNENNLDWNEIGITNETKFNINRPGYEKYDFAVSRVIDSDTSEIHTSLDSTACRFGCGKDCEIRGPWFVRFVKKTPFNLGLWK